jgi:hypothetical protein
MKVNVKFANGNGMAFLSQGYITSDDKKVFVRLYTTLKFNRIILFYKTECYYQYQLMAQLEIAFKVMDFKLL